ncbi:MAG: LysM peptidoglycan-binding domain-containing protein, partial [Bacteroidia bacterium]
QGNNHFGIKCKKTWTGKTIYEDDDAPGECFRAYDSAYLSYIDHSEFLLGNVRYAFLFEYDRTDYKSWAHGLKEAGYATNPKYPELLITIIERHELHKLDHLKTEDLDIPPDLQLPKEKPEQPEKTEEGLVVFNDIPATRVQAGDNIVSLAKRNEMGAWEIRRYNDLPKEQELTPGEIIYLKPKKRKGSVPYHVVQPGETMWSISQMYGIKLKHLYRKNKLDKKASEQPVPGQTLYLQASNPAHPLTSERKESPVMKVVLPENPHTPGDTVVNMEKPGETAPVEHTPVMSTEPAISPKEVQDTLNIPREKNDISEEVHVHTVSAGETLFIIAKKYQTSVEQIRELNSLPDYSIKLGQLLIINDAAKEPVADTETTSFVHTVQAGETLYAIAKKYNMEVDELKQINKLVNETLSIGQKLKLNKSETETLEKSTNELPATHKVEKGDTLYSLSRKYQISVSDLKKLNNLQSEVISIGQVLKLK